MKYPTCVLIAGNGRIVVCRTDVYCYCGFPVHLCGDPWWWAESLCDIPEG